MQLLLLFKFYGGYLLFITDNFSSRNKPDSTSDGWDTKLGHRSLLDQLHLF